MSKFLTLLLFLTLNQLSFATNSEVVHRQAGTLAVLAEDAINGEEIDFYEFMKLWDSTLRKSRVKPTDSYTNLDKIYENHLLEIQEKETVSIEDIEEIRIKLFRQGLSSYCDDKALMSDFIKFNCGNCDAQTRLVSAFFMPLENKLSSNLEYGIQVFKDHIRPVLINHESGLLIDLVYGRAETLNSIDANVYNSKLFYWAYLNAFQLTKIKIKDFILIDKSSRVPEQSKIKKLLSFNKGSQALSFDGYLKFGVHNTKFNKTNRPNPKKAIIAFQKLSREKTPQTRGINNESITFGYDGIPSDDTTSFSANKTRATAKMYTGFPLSELSDTQKQINELAFSTAPAPQQKVQEWVKVSTDNRYNFLPTAKLIIHNDRLHKEWNSRGIIGKNKLVYANYRKHLDLLYTDVSYQAMIQLIKNPFTIEKIDSNTLKKVKLLASRLDSLNKFKYNYLEKVIAHMSVNLTGLWDSDIKSNVLQDFIEARGIAFKNIEGKEVDFIKTISRLAPKKKYEYFQFLKLIRGENDSIMRMKTRIETLDFLKPVRNELLNLDFEIAKKIKLEDKKIITVDTSNISLGGKFSTKEASEEEEVEIKITAQTFAFIVLSSASLDLENPRIQQAFYMSLDKEDFNEIQSQPVFKSSLKRISNLRTLNGLNPYMTEDIIKRFDLNVDVQAAKYERTLGEKVFITSKETIVLIGKDYYSLFKSTMVDRNGVFYDNKIETIRNGCFDNALSVTTKQKRGQTDFGLKTVDRSVRYLNKPGINSKCGSNDYQTI